MILSRLTFLVALYIALDVANPMMPGALAFQADDSVEVRLARVARADEWRQRLRQRPSV